MKAIRVSEFGSPSVLKLHSGIPIPSPGPKQAFDKHAEISAHEVNLCRHFHPVNLPGRWAVQTASGRDGGLNRVLIKVHACGVNPVEAYIRAGTYARKPSLPYTPGTDAAGVVVGVGDRVTSLKTGDRVFTTATDTGAYAEFAVAPEDSTYRLPDSLDYVQGAAIGIPYFTAYRALFHKARAKPGETVLVHGASGGVGVASCQLARAMGMKVLGTAGTSEGLALVLKAGAHQAFNHREQNYIGKIKEAASDHGVDVVVEMLSNVNLSNDLQILARGGRVAIVGCRGTIEINPRDTMMRESSIIGVSLFSTTSAEMAEAAAVLFAGMEAGWLKPVVGGRYSLDKATEAQEDVISSPGATGKVVLIM